VVAQVTYHDSPDYTLFELKLVPLTEPFTGRCEHFDLGEIEHYPTHQPVFLSQ
jgi:hypothetical protein